MRPLPYPAGLSAAVPTADAFFLFATVVVVAFASQAPGIQPE